MSREELKLSILFKRSFDDVKSLPLFFGFYWVILFVLDILNFTLQTQWVQSEEASRFLEIGYQLFVVLVTVSFFHAMNLIRNENKFGVGKIFLETLLLVPGFILQSIFFALAVGLGTLLLIAPGLFALVVFYFAPIFSVLYPDYEGKLFLHTREMVQPHFFLTLTVLLVSGIIPFLPDGIIWLLTGNLKSVVAAIASPLDAGVYLFCQLLVFNFAFELIERDRRGQQGTERDNKYQID